MERILVTRSSLPDIEEYIDEINSMWDTHWLTNMGEKHRKLCEELKRFLNIEGLELFTNGHMALELSLQALELQGEVITTPFTFASTTHAIIRSGLTPVFCDIREDDFTLDADKIEALITDKTCAILPVHVYGNVCNIEKINEIADKYNLKIIYDAAHAFGVKYKGVGIANFGDISCFSFHATKVFHTIEGGAACFHDFQIGQKLRRLKNFGIKNEEEVDAIGTNAKMNEFCAAMGICNMRHIEEEIEKRKNITERYMENLSDIKGIRFHTTKKDVVSNYAYFPILVEEQNLGINRDELFQKLRAQGVGVRKYFYPCTNTYKCFDGKFNPHTTPVALAISNKILTLPLYADLSIDAVDKICRIIGS